MTLLSRLFALAALVALVPAHATPYPMQYNFTGMVVQGTAPWAPANTFLSGYFRFDAATPPSSAGVWNLPTAVFHVQYADLTIDTVGASAQVSPTGEAIRFDAFVPPTEFPFSVFGGTLEMQFETFTDNYFSLSKLPTTVPPNDHSLILWNDGNLFAGTDTDFSPTVPEPATAAFFLAGLIGLGARRKRRAASA